MKVMSYRVDQKIGIIEYKYSLVILKGFKVRDNVKYSLGKLVKCGLWKLQRQITFEYIILRKSQIKSSNDNS